MYKQADGLFSASALQPHQSRLVNRLADPNVTGLVAAHGVGAGKSLSSIEAYKRLGLPTTVIVPASLQDNYKGELNKWLGSVPANMRIVSQQMVARKGIEPYDNPFLIIDEAQKMRDPSSKLYQALKQSKSRKRLLLSGTPLFNHPSDASALVNFAANKPVLPIDKGQFEQQYIENNPQAPGLLRGLFNKRPAIEGPQLKDTKHLKKIMQQYIDYYATGKEGYPAITQENVPVQMTGPQSSIYKGMMGKLPPLMRWKVQLGLPAGKNELNRMKSFLIGPRMVSDSTNEFVRSPLLASSPKVTQAVDYLQNQIKTNPRYKAVVYSNFLKSGLDPYANELRKRKMNFGTFTGNDKPENRQKAIDDFNNDRLAALLISSAGSEGISLKGTRLAQIMDPHWNSNKLTQVIGRSARYKSHEHLDPKDRNVLVQNYIAEPKAGLLDRLLGRQTIKGVDQYMYDMSAKKQTLNDQLTALMQQK